MIEETDYVWAGALTERRVTSHLILHHMAASGFTAQDIHRVHIGNGWSGIAYHYYVRKDGRVYRGRPENVQGGHTQGWNRCSIGICFEGNFEKESMGQTQLAAGKALVREICRRYPGITVAGHREFNATACPGRQFPMAEMKEAGVLDNVPDNYAAQAVAWAREKNILRGDGDGDLKLHESVTRQDMLVFLWRSLGGES